MKTGIFKKSVLSAAFVLAGIGATGVYASGDVRATPQAASISQMNKLTEQHLQQWVKGLQTSIPYYDVVLKSYEGNDKGGVATLIMSMGDPKNKGSRTAPYVGLEMKIDIEHGLFIEDGVTGIARFNSTTRLAEGSLEEFYKLEVMLLQALEHLEYIEVGLIKPSGDYYSKIESTKPYIVEGLFDTDSKLTVTPFVYKAESYNSASLGRTSLHMPLISFENYDEDVLFTIKNIRVDDVDRPLRDAYFDLNGKTKATIEAIELKRDEGFFRMNDVLYTGVSSVDTKGLLHSQFTTGFTGSENLSADLRDVAGSQELAFGVVIEGNLENLHADTLMELMGIAMKNPELLDDEENVEQIMFDMLRYAPKFDLNKIAVTLNKHQGNFTLNAQLDAFTESDRDMSLYLLLLQKFSMTATMDVPVEWVMLFGGDEEILKTIVEMSDGRIIRENNRLKSNIEYKNGNVRVNGKSMSGFGLPF